MPSNTGLHNHVHVSLVDLNDAVHVGEVDADTPIRGREVALETGASRVGDDGDTVTVTDSDNGGNLISGSRISHSHRELIGVDRRPARVAVSMQIVRICGYDVFLIPKLPYDV